MEAVIEERLVDNPSYTDGLYYGDSEQIRDRNMRVVVSENAMTRIGAFSYIKARHRLPHHERVAERFKSEYEALFGSGVPALDNSRPVVDRSPVAHDSGMAAKIDGGASIKAAMAFLGAVDRDKLIAWLVLCAPLHELADRMPKGSRNQRQVAGLVADRLAVLDRLALHWSYGSRWALHQFEI
jgi:hypothetical protein